MQYRKKPVIIEAEKYDGSTESILRISKMGLDPVKLVHDQFSGDYILIPTLEGEMKAEIGSYIIKGVKGEFYPCRGDIFEETYEEINK